MITDEQIARYPFLAVLRYYGHPLTRQAYLEAAYLGHPPAELGPELDSGLPPELQESYERDIDEEEQ